MPNKTCLLLLAGAAVVAYFSTAQTNKVPLLGKVYLFGAGLAGSGS